MGLWTDSKGMLVAAQTLMQADSSFLQLELFMPIYYLLGHGIEVALKSVLLAHGSSLRELKKEIGHDLKKAEKRVVALNLDPLSCFVTNNACLIRSLNWYYQRKFFEYRVTGSAQLPLRDELAAFLHQLLVLARPHAVEALRSSL
jgi:hypothetical protein